MQHLEVSCAVRPIKWPLGVKWLIHDFKSQNKMRIQQVYFILCFKVMYLNA